MLLAGGAAAAGSIFLIAITLFITVLETAVAFIQAYVFCLLTIIYLNDSFYLH
jgi:F0F1-type ATP synthase membrane subunit a